MAEVFRISVDSVIDLILLRREAIISGRGTRPWRSGIRDFWGLYDTGGLDGPVIYEISTWQIFETRQRGSLPLTVQVALGSTEGWEALFGGADHLR